MNGLAQVVVQEGIKNIIFRVVGGCAHGLDACMDGGRSVSGFLHLKKIRLLHVVPARPRSWSRDARSFASQFQFRFRLGSS